MRAVAYKAQGPIANADSLIDLDIDKPKAAGRDLLVEVKAVSVNPVDTKMRMNLAPDASGLRVLGYDASGIVREVGPDVTLFKAGDEVYYAGSNIRPGSNAEFQLVDERIVGHKPKTLSHAQAAAMPLTSLTAWEMLFDRLNVKAPVPGTKNVILIIGGAGGVGSLAIHFAREVAGPHRDRDRVTAGDGEVGEGHGRASCHRPHQADGAADQGARPRRAALRVLDRGREGHHRRHR